MTAHAFRRTLDHIRADSETERAKGFLFERLMKAFFTEDPVYRERFSRVWLWSEWVPRFNEAEAASMSGCAVLTACCSRSRCQTCQL